MQIVAAGDGNRRSSDIRSMYIQSKIVHTQYVYHPLRTPYGSASSPCLSEGRTAIGEANLCGSYVRSTRTLLTGRTPTDGGLRSPRQA